MRMKNVMDRLRKVRKIVSVIDSTFLGGYRSIENFVDKNIDYIPIRNREHCVSETVFKKAGDEVVMTKGIKFDENPYPFTEWMESSRVIRDGDNRFNLIESHIVNFCGDKTNVSYMQSSNLKVLCFNVSKFPDNYDFDKFYDDYYSLFVYDAYETSNGLQNENDASIIKFLNDKMMNVSYTAFCRIAAKEGTDIKIDISSYKKFLEETLDDGSAFHFIAGCMPEYSRNVAEVGSTLDLSRMLSTLIASRDAIYPIQYADYDLYGDNLKDFNRILKRIRMNVVPDPGNI